jgi:hypothetical protein
VTLLPLALLLSLGAAPQGRPCEGERLTLLPFDAVAVSRADARRAEEVLRRALARNTATPGVCLEPRKETVERLLALGGKLAPCSDETCRTAQVKALATQWVVRGRVLGLGGERTVALVLVGPEGQETRETFTLPVLEAGAEDAASRAFTALWRTRSHQPVARKTLRPWPQVLMGTGAAALAAGIGFGLASRSTERRLSQGTEGCAGVGDEYSRCIARELRKGERQSLIANSLLGTGVMLGAGGAILFIWELP